MFGKKISNKDLKNILQCELDTLETEINIKKKELEEFNHNLKGKKLLEEEINKLKIIIEIFLSNDYFRINK